jgi:hypothetical protein
LDLAAKTEIKTYYRIQHITSAGSWETLPYGVDFGSVKEAVDFISKIERPEYFGNYRIVKIDESIAATFDGSLDEEKDQIKASIL